MAPTSASLTEADIEAAVRVLRSGELAGPDHPEIRSFEEALADSSGVRFTSAVNSGTAAIHAILTAIGVGRGDEVIVPAQTFIATATPVLMCGAVPVVVDVDRETHCIRPSAVSDALTSRTRCVIAVHLNGHPAPMDMLPPDVPVIGDACQAQGAMLHSRPICTFGVASAYSFWQDKVTTAAGEGGAVLSDDSALIQYVRLVRSHGQEGIAGTSNSHHVTLGYNYRMTAVQAAVAHSQLSRLSRITEDSRAHALMLSSLLANLPAIVLPVERDGAKHIFWKYVVRLDLARVNGDRGDVVGALHAEGVAAAPRYPIPLGRQPVIAANGRVLPCPVAEELAETLFTLPLSACSSFNQIEAMAGAVRRVMKKLSR